MRKRVLCGILLLLLLGGCARERTLPELKIEFPPLIYPKGMTMFRYDPEPETDWQRAYLEVLADTRERNGSLGRLQDLYYTRGYYLHDIDEDGIPELILEHGVCEVGSYGEVISCPGDAPYPMGLIPLDHVSLYSWPGENALFSRRYVSNFEKVSFHYLTVSVEPVAGRYDRKTGVKELVPGAEQLDLYSIECDLPIMDYGKTCPVVPCVDDAAVCERLLDTVRDNGMVYGASIHGYDGDTGYCDFSRYLSTLNWGEGVTPVRYLFADLNRDGQRECVLDAEACLVVLSLEENTVYAYSESNFPQGSEACCIYDDGTIYSHDREPEYEWAYMAWEFWTGLSFSKNNCYEYTTNLTPGAEVIPWEELQ